MIYLQVPLDLICLYYTVIIRKKEMVLMQMYMNKNMNHSILINRCYILNGIEIK